MARCDADGYFGSSTISHHIHISTDEMFDFYSTAVAREMLISVFANALRLAEYPSAQCTEDFHPRTLSLFLFHIDTYIYIIIYNRYIHAQTPWLLLPVPPAPHGLLLLQGMRHGVVLESVLLSQLNSCTCCSFGQSLAPLCIHCAALN